MDLKETKMPQDDYPHLTISMSDEWYKKYLFQRKLAKLLCKYPAIGRHIRELGAKFYRSSNRFMNICTRLEKLGYLGVNEAENRKFISVLEGNDSNPLIFGSSYGYEDEKRELYVAQHYRYQILNQEQGNDIKSESFDIYERIESVISDILSHDVEIKEVINFGVSYAYVDSLLAEKFNHVKFVGIDRSSLTKKYNEKYFSHIKNMTFHAGDVFQYLCNRKQDRCLLLHVRTMSLLPANFIANLYQSCYQSNVKYIVGLEHVGISRQSEQPYRFSINNKPSVLFRNSMFIHNYPALWRNAGYMEKSTELLKTRHPDDDLFFLTFTAARKEY